MKFLVAFVAVVAVAVASPIFKPASDDLAHVAAIVEAINSPSTDPATAVLLEQQLGEILAAMSPISVGPAIVDVPVSPIAIGAPVVEVPAHDGGALTVFPEESQSVPHPFPTWEPVKPSPVVIGEIPAGAPTPLVQIIVNVNDQASPAVVPGAVAQPIAPEGVSVAVPVLPGPVNVVEGVAIPVDPVSVAAPVSPISVATPVEVSPISVAAPVEVSPISVAAPVVVSPVSVAAPVAVSPVSVGTPVIAPSPAVSLPETLN